MPLSQAAMEVLADFAYNQPVTRAYIEQVRGVDYDAVIQGLVAQKPCGRKKGASICRAAPLILRHHRRFSPVLRAFFAGRAAAHPAAGRGRNGRNKY